MKLRKIEPGRRVVTHILLIYILTYITYFLKLAVDDFFENKFFSLKKKEKF